MYNGIMINDVPNFAFSIGYFSGYGASWTRKADMAGLYFTKLINYMKNEQVSKMVPRLDPNVGLNLKAFDGGLTSGYWTRSANFLPKQGDKYPWTGGISYFEDIINLRNFNTDCLELTYAKKDKKSS